MGNMRFLGSLHITEHRSRVGHISPFALLGDLSCADRCGSRLVITDRYNYGCSSFHHGGPAACANDARLQRVMLERELLAGIERDLLSDEAVAEAGRRYARAVRERSRPRPVDRARVSALQAEVANFVQAIAGGLNSPALAARLADAESELTRFQKAAETEPPTSIPRLVPRIADQYRDLVRRLADTINETDPARGRAVIRDLVGEVRVEVDEKEIRLISRHAGIERALARAAGAPLQISVVAGEDLKLVCCVSRGRHASCSLTSRPWAERECRLLKARPVAARVSKR